MPSPPFFPSDSIVAEMQAIEKGVPIKNPDRESLARRERISRECRSFQLFHPPLRQGGSLRPLAVFP